MNPSSPKPSAGDRSQIPPGQSSRFHGHQLLLQAVAERDVERAVLLAQRCVHRYGMSTLESLFCPANGSHEGDAEGLAWLLPLLKQPASASDPTAPEQKALFPDQPLTMFGSDEGPKEGTPVSPSTLDEVFAPLEIAFPPLPSIAGELPSAEEPVISGPVSFSLSVEALDAPEPPPEVSPIPLPPEDIPLSPEDIAPSAEEPMGYEEGEAAPVPAFHSEASADISSPPRRVRGPERARAPEQRRGSFPPPPISEALKPWLSWLHGPEMFDP